MDGNRVIPTLYLVVPCYNEEEVIDKTAAVMKDKMQRLMSGEKIKPDSKVLFVNDGSRDGTLNILHTIAKESPMFGVLSLVGNYGHQSAILAGMMTARNYADAVVTIDADLQQDIEALDEFLRSYMDGCEVVYGVRNDRSSDGFMKKTTATMYYKLMHLLGSKVLTNHADYRLLSKKALDALSEYHETSLFLRGLIPTMGFPSDVVYFDVKERAAGKSKYTLKKMMTLAMDGITSMSVRPLRMITGAGVVTVLAAVLLLLYMIVHVCQGNVLPGYMITVLFLLLIGGVIILSIGITGEYIGKIYMETKKRPRYTVDTLVLRDPGSKE